LGKYDSHLEKCRSFARKSKADVRFGAFIEKNGKIIGFGRCRLSTKKERQISRIDSAGRRYRLDYCLHAEEDAYFKALSSRENLSGAVLYVAGFLKNGKPFLRPRAYFTCRRCATRVLLRGDLPVRIPTKSGWQELSPREAFKTSLSFFKKGFWGSVAKRRQKQSK